MVLLFDVANTLLYKPLLFEKAKKVLNKFGFDVPMEHLRSKHKIISEVIVFPDRTNIDFYNQFNKEWMYAVGVIPNVNLLNSLFEACSYLPWEKFDDTSALKEITSKKSIISNFHNGLFDLLDKNFPNEFDTVIVSENELHRKPDIRFYQEAINRLNVNPNEIVYIGDSIKLDIEPALNVGMKAFLIDRYNDFPFYKNRLNSLFQLKEILK